MTYFNGAVYNYDHNGCASHGHIVVSLRGDVQAFCGNHGVFRGIHVISHDDGMVHEAFRSLHVRLSCARRDGSLVCAHDDNLACVPHNDVVVYVPRSDVVAYVLHSDVVVACNVPHDDLVHDVTGNEWLMVVFHHLVLVLLLPTPILSQK